MLTTLGTADPLIPIAAMNFGPKKCQEDGIRRPPVALTMVPAGEAATRSAHVQRGPNLAPDYVLLAGEAAGTAASRPEFPADHHAVSCRLRAAALDRGACRRSGEAGGFPHARGPGGHHFSYPKSTARICHGRPVPAARNSVGHGRTSVNSGARRSAGARRRHLRRRG